MPALEDLCAFSCRSEEVSNEADVSYQDGTSLLSLSKYLLRDPILDLEPRCVNQVNRLLRLSSSQEIRREISKQTRRIEHAISTCLRTHKSPSSNTTLIPLGQLVVL